MRRAMELLRGTEESVATAARQVGYETQGKFSRAFQDVTGLLPAEPQAAAAVSAADAFLQDSTLSLVSTAPAGAYLHFPMVLL